MYILNRLLRNRQRGGTTILMNKDRTSEKTVKAKKKMTVESRVGNRACNNTEFGVSAGWYNFSAIQQDGRGGVI